MKSQNLKSIAPVLDSLRGSVFKGAIFQIYRIEMGYRMGYRTMGNGKTMQNC